MWYAALQIAREFVHGQLSPLLRDYTQDQYMSKYVTDMQRPHILLKHSISDDVLKMDFGFKVHDKGVLTVMTSTNLVAAQYYGTAGLSDVKDGLHALAMRMQQLGTVSRGLMADANDGTFE